MRIRPILFLFYLRIYFASNKRISGNRMHLVIKKSAKAVWQSGSRDHCCVGFVAGRLFPTRVSGRAGSVWAGRGTDVTPCCATDAAVSGDTVC